MFHVEHFERMFHVEQFSLTDSPSGKVEYVSDMMGWTMKDVTGAELNNPLDVQVGGAHYKEWVIQPIEFTMANLYDACSSSIFRYVARHRDKNGREDILKALHYVELREQLAGASLIDTILNGCRLDSKWANLRANLGWAMEADFFIAANGIEPNAAEAMLALEDWLWTDSKAAKQRLIDSLNTLLAEYD